MNIIYSRKAIDRFAQLPRGIRKRISTKMRFFAHQPDPLEYAIKLSGFDLYRFRIGDYRLIFEVIGQTILVVDIRKRDDAYKDL